MAKTKISITIDEKLVNKLDEMLNDERFRNRSHIFEYSLKSFLVKEGRND